MHSSGDVAFDTNLLVGLIVTNLLTFLFGACVGCVVTCARTLPTRRHSFCIAKRLNLRQNSLLNA
jgi:uncharacterized membrane protein